MFACLANGCVLLRIVEKLPDPDLSLHSEIHDGLKYHERKQMRPLTLICKVGLVLFKKKKNQTSFPASLLQAGMF